MKLLQKPLQRVFLFILFAFVFFVLLIFGAFFGTQVQAASIIDSGNCGYDGSDNVVWTLYSDGSLVISGSGDMEDYYALPWFDQGESVTSVEIQNGVTTVGRCAFSTFFPNLKTVSIASSVTMICDSAFKNCQMLEKVYIQSSNSIRTIGSFAFYQCNNLKDFTDQYYMTSIGNQAFKGCSSLEAFTVSGDVGDYAFEDCSNLEYIDFVRNTSSVGRYVFGGCLHLKQFYVDKYNYSVESTDGCLYGKYKYKFMRYPPSREGSYYQIPDSVYEIYEGAFEDCANLLSITIPSSVDKLNGWPCYRSGIKDIYFGGTKDQWNKLIKGIPTSSMAGVTIHFNNYVNYDYSTNGGTSATATTLTVSEGSAIDLSPTATKSGWTFVGWNTSSNATTALSSLTMGSSDVSLYAIFKKTLTGTFVDYSGTTKKTTTKTVTIYNNATNGTVSAPTQNTYTGWTKRGWSTGTSSNASTTTNYSISTDTTFYGTYQRTLTLSYNANGGNSTPSGQTGTQYANSYNITNTKNPSFTLAAAISKTGGCKFDKWALGSTAGTKYSEKATVTISKDTTAYATWQSHQYGNWTRLNETQHQRVCLNGCGQKETQDHIWGDWLTTVEPTTDSSGVRERRCQICSASEQEELQRLELRDEKTNISVIFNDWVEGDPTVHLVVHDNADAGLLPVSAEVRYHSVEIKLNDENGGETQPKQAVEVRLPLPDGYDPNHIVIYHRHSNDFSNVEEITDFWIEPDTITVDGNVIEKDFIVFLTDSFSTFIIVDTSMKPQPQPENVCPWCGGQHEGFFQKIIGFFHNIFANIFGARY